MSYASVTAAKHAPALSIAVAIGAKALGLALDEALGLLKWNAERLGAHGGERTTIGAEDNVLGLGHLLDLLLAFRLETVGLERLVSTWV